MIKKASTKLFCIITLMVLISACFTMKVSAEQLMPNHNHSHTNALLSNFIISDVLDENKKEENYIKEEIKENESVTAVKTTPCWWGGLKAYIISKNTIDKVPLFNQLDYPDTPYGDYGSVASHGCGITSVAMVASYMNDIMYSPEALARQFGNYNTESGSYWVLMEDSAEILGIDFQERTYDTDKVMEALANGQPVIALQSEGLFTSGGHFIVLTGLNEKGLIMVNDPNGANYYKSKLVKGFKNGFTEEQVFSNGGPYWIYDKKAEQKDKPFLSIGILNREFNLTKWFAN